jgi:HpiC1 cyclase/Bacterial Ig-like domain (group 3)/FG-GAP-like repeat/Viral BACON domain/Right handed beta helix region/CARDB
LTSSTPKTGLNSDWRFSASVWIILAALLTITAGVATLVVRAASLTISNASFETATLPISSGNGPYSNLLTGQGTLGSWTASTTSANALAGGWAPTLGGSNWTSKWWTGNNVVILQVNAAGTVTLSQTLSDTLQNNTSYVFSAKVGRRNTAPFNYSLQLSAGSTVLGSASNLSLASNSSGTDTLVYNSGANNPAAGQPLIIALTSTTAGAPTEVSFDDISLIATPTVSSVTTLTSSPSPSAQLGQAVTLTATVSPASATGTVTFYDSETILGVATLTNGQASLTTSLLPSGQRALQAYFPGKNEVLASRSTPLHFTVNAAAVGGFGTPVTNAIAGGASDSVIGDFNGDGKADLAVVQYPVNKVSILLGVGNGTFATHVDYDAGAEPSRIAAGDFNGDGKTDLVIASISTSGAVRILFGSGTGTFGSPVTYPLGSYTMDVAVGDFNLDGKADIVAVSLYSSVSIFIGKGDGTFQSSVPYGTGSTGPVSRAVAVGDFNADGIPDIAAGNSTAGTIGILLGNGDGSFQTATTVNAVNPQVLAIADMNGDGKEDVVTPNPTSQTAVLVLLSNGNGTFQPYQSYNTNQNNGTGVLTIADFNGDGRPDVVVSSSYNITTVMLNNGAGALSTLVDLTLVPGLSDAAIGDFNGDGLPDLAAAAGAAVTVALGIPRPPADLVPQNITLSASAVEPAANITVSWTLANIGTAAASAASTTVVRITPNLLSSAGTDLGSFPTPALAAGASVTQSVTVAAPTYPATFYVWVIADRFGTANQFTLNDAQPLPLTVTLDAPVLNMSQSLAALNLGQNLVPNNPAFDARPSIQNAINFATSHTIGTLTLDPGAYYLKSDTQINATLGFGKLNKNLTVDFAGSTLYFPGPTIAVSGIAVFESDNLTLTNFKIDFVTRPQIHVQLTSVNAQQGVLSYQTIPGFPDPSTFNGLGAPLVWAVAFRNGQIVPGTARMQIAMPISGNQITLTPNGPPWTQSATLSTLQAGDTIVVAPFCCGPPLSAFTGNKITFSNITVYGAPANAVHFDYATNSTIDNVRVVPVPGTGLIGSNADGIDLGIGQNNHLKNSYVKGTLDDAMTAGGGLLGTVVNKTDARHLTIKRFGYAYFSSGNIVNFVDPLTTLESPGPTIVSQIPVTLTDFNQQVQLTVDQDLPASLPAGTLVTYGDTTMRGQGSTIEDNLVEDIYTGRGIWVSGGKGITINRNVVRRTSMSGIDVRQDTQAYPSPPAHDMTISNNAVESALGPAEVGTGTQDALGAIEVASTNNQDFAFATSPANSNMNVVNNYVADSGRSGIWMGEVNGGTVQNNLVIRWNQHPEFAIFGIPQQFIQQVSDDRAVPVVFHYNTGVVETGDVTNLTSTVMAPVTMTPASLSVSGGSGSGSFQLQTAVDGFGWKAVSDAAWLIITSSTTGAGSTTVQYTIAANTTGVSRTGHISIAGEILTVTQDATAKRVRGQIISQ